MKIIKIFSGISLLFLVTQLSGCAHIGMELYGRLKGPPSIEEVQKKFAESMNVSPDKVVISNIKERESSGGVLTGASAKDYTFDAAVSGKTKNCSLKKLINDEIYFTGCTVKNAALTNW
ncbi:hypothetical protein [Erwinia billingiae]|uniref:hypothetical protein n=1 Tax=Erwinia billingiae TaxID=182337 RepID=UPI002245A3F8|nr:hypothetical protein [Erwinia billingiae]MCX0499663.1 hypothetical protein [Erwinia billingiae]